MYEITFVKHVCNDRREPIVGVVLAESTAIAWFLERAWQGPQLTRCPHCEDIQPLPTSLSTLLAIIEDEKGR